MAAMLTKLPQELFDGVTAELDKSDLISLSRVSKQANERTARALWQSVTITAPSADRLDDTTIAGLPQICNEIVTRFHFRYSLEDCTRHRCPHEYTQYFESSDEDDEMEADSEDDAITADRDDEYDSSYPAFDRLTRRVKSVLGRFRAGQLRSFSWDLGTCVVSEVLGRQGIICLNHPSLQSLSLTTNAICSRYDDDDREIDLSPFQHLRRLRWKAPKADHLTTLSLAIRSNSARLQRLELDFVSWAHLLDELLEGGDGNDEIQTYFVKKIFQLPRYFPDLRVLSLSQVPLTAAVALAVNFDTLTSLTLRNCPGGDEFLEHVLERRCSIKLKTLEIRYDFAIGILDYVMRDFLDAFEGLEELFVCELGSVDTIDFWNHVAHHGATLRNMVHHQRTSDLDDESPYAGEMHDLQDLALFGEPLRQLKHDPSQNPLARLDLECIALSCEPLRLRYILQPFVSKSSLKLLHIRQSLSDIHRYESVAVQPMIDMRLDVKSEYEGRASEELADSASSGSGTSCSLFSDADVIPESNDEGVAGEQHEALAEFRPEFRKLIEWIFGPEGISSLQTVAFGDFANIDPYSSHNRIFCRNTQGGCNFQVLDQFSPVARKISREYCHILQACPIEPLSG
ncbi:hypothetical protein F5Y18DRAFT_408045 [Xylariaceae sp. FL1019]|nr:hypothetical protein F5Y18DRAFT_408045 [Xylariaceae sp. FL1019]